MLKLHALTSWQLDANAFIIRSEKTRARPAFFCNGCTATLRKIMLNFTCLCRNDGVECCVVLLM